MRFSLAALAVLLCCSCHPGVAMKPDFNAALQKHFDAIENRDINAFKAHLTSDKTLYTIVQNGHAFTTPAEITAIHADWFKQTGWEWKGTVVHTVVGSDMAMALVKYSYRAKPEDKPFESWLTYVFRLENNEWKIVHDQNTALDFHAFAKSAGIE
ncbi:MAG: nuclear transport factor 2 family protein [Alphaproteobacteria bacterium]